MCNKTPVPVRSIRPSYAPGLGVVPVNETVIVPEAPAANVMLAGLTVTEALLDLTCGTVVADRVTELLPLLVRVICCVIGKVDATPKETVVGLAKTVCAIAAPASNRPAPIHSTLTRSLKKSSVVVS